MPFEKSEEVDPGVDQRSFQVYLGGVTCNVSVGDGDHDHLSIRNPDTKPMRTHPESLSVRNAHSQDRALSLLTHALKLLDWLDECK